MTETEQVIAAIECHTGLAGKRIGKNTRVRCPAHDDQHPSLDVAEGNNGKPLVICRSHGCSYEAICAAIGWHRNGDGPEIVATYPYVDEGGKVLFEVLRYFPKSFKQRRPDGFGDYVWNLKDVRRVPYRLPEVIAAVGAGRPVVIPEGEKDVEVLRRCGITATCNPMGAGKWKREYARYFRGAKVMVVADRDSEGRKHAGQVYESLKSVAASVRVFEPAEGNDISDHFAAKLRIADLVEVDPATLNGKPPPKDEAPKSATPIRLVDPRTLTMEPTEYLGDDTRIPIGMSTMFVGDGGLGKSLYTILLAAQITKAGDGVIFASAEDDRAKTWLPRLRAAGVDLDRVRLIRLAHSDGDLDWDETITIPTDLLALREGVETLDAELDGGRTKLVVIDPMEAHLGDELGEGNSSLRRRVALGPVEALANSLDIAILLVHHVSKDTAQRASYRVLGTVANRNAPRSMLLFGANPEEEVPDGAEGVERILYHDKHNTSAKSPTELYRVVPVTVTREDGVAISTARLEYLKDIEIDPEEVFGRRPRETKTDAAVSFLVQTMDDGEWHDSRGLQILAAAQEISKRTLQRAARELGIEYDPREFPASTFWRLPQMEGDAGNADDADGGAA